MGTWMRRLTHLAGIVWLIGCSGSSSTSSGAPGDASADSQGAPGQDGGVAPGGDGGFPQDAGGTDGPQVPEASLDGGASIGSPSAAVVSDAVATALSLYHRNASTGDIWCLPCDGAPVMLAVASYTGDTTADARLLQQMRYLLGNGNEPFGTGGYAANDERNATAMYAIAKRVPRVWSQLTAAEVNTIDVIMEATLVSDIYATADKTNASGPPRTLDGSTDSNRDFNPNYREGMIGAVLVGTEYFGGESAVTAMMASYDHAAFTAQLQTMGLNNLYWTFSTYLVSPSAGAPSPATVQAGITGYAMHGITLGQLLDMYVYLGSNTFSANVSCGLNGGAGILYNGVYAGRLVAGCSGLSNEGSLGMELEFDSVDGNGPRSSQSYARLGLRDDLFNQLVLVVYGDWMDTTASKAVLTQLNVGVADYFYKAKNGYEDYSEGIDQGLFTCGTMTQVANGGNYTDCPLNQATWTEVLAPAHGM
jgi:hypothetical protein